MLYGSVTANSHTLYMVSEIKRHVAVRNATGRGLTFAGSGVLVKASAAGVIELAVAELAFTLALDELRAGGESLVLALEREWPHVARAVREEFGLTEPESGEPERAPESVTDL